MNVWISSDHHLGEDRFSLMQRPFSSIDEHNNCIIENHNKLVGVNDTVYFNGDVLYQKGDIEANINLISQINGKKILIRGNHDRPISDEQFAPYFEQIVPEGKGVELEVGGISCYVTHYPTRAMEAKFNLVGHIHAAWKFQLNSMNVGVDVNHFSPLNLDSIPFFVKAITEFYDEDVWVAYRPENASYRETRGKKDVYFKD